ncbi:MAG: nucleoside hydrolase [Armatimonadetes bacterium]|nr:nucleoside hydrolase [Armatimonadota bacterium]
MLLVPLLTCLLGAGNLPVAPTGGAPPPILGDYNSELRRGDHVDGEALAARLSELGANTYYWLIWHSANDWDDLQSFLPLARQAGIQVWPYLVPPTESGPDYPYSEPFKLDYVRWAEEIARLSLKFDNLPGYVIDDFWANVSPTRFSPEYIGKMVAAGKAINPKLKFYPLMYYPEIGPRFARTIAPLVDGVVAAYARGPEDVERALPYLDDTYHLPPGACFTYPWNAPSKPGDHLLLTQTCKVTDAAHAGASFRVLDDFDGPTAGYHFLQLRVDGDVVWQEDAAGTDNAAVTVDLAKAVAGKATVRLALGVWDEKGVSNFGVTASFANLRLTGLELPQPDLSAADGWTEDKEGAFTLEREPAVAGGARHRLPLVMMPAGQRGEYAGRHGEEGTAERIAAQVKLSLRYVAAGRAEGVVTYCLDKSPGNPDFDAVRQVYHDFAARKEPRPMPDRPIPTILDTDIGGDIDDTWALALLLRSPELDLKMVSTDTGNTTYRAKIAAKLLQAAGRSDVDVAVGLHQSDAAGGQAEWVKDYDLATYPGRVEQDGVAALIRKIRESPRPITLICIGAMPNIAAALRQAPDIAGKCHFVGMHGSVRVGYDGSAKVSAEANVVNDASACRAVFEAPWLSRTITPLDTCGLVHLTGDLYQQVRQSQALLPRLVMENYEHWSKAVHGPDPAVQSSTLFDTVAVWLAFSRDFVTMEPLPIRVTNDGFTRIEEGAPRLDVASGWTDQAAFERELVARMVGR